MTPFEFFDKPYLAKARILAISASEDFVILDCVLFDILPAHDRETDTLPMAIAALCMAVLCISAINMSPQLPKLL